MCALFPLRGCYLRALGWVTSAVPCVSLPPPTVRWGTAKQGRHFSPIPRAARPPTYLRVARRRSSAGQIRAQSRNHQVRLPRVCCEPYKLCLRPQRPTNTLEFGNKSTLRAGVAETHAIAPPSAARERLVTVLAGTWALRGRGRKGAWLGTFPRALDWVVVMHGGTRGGGEGLLMRPSRSLSWSAADDGNLGTFGRCLGEESCACVRLRCPIGSQYRGGRQARLNPGRIGGKSSHTCARCSAACLVGRQHVQQ